MGLRRDVVHASACDAVRVVFAVEWPGATFWLVLGAFRWCGIAECRCVGLRRDVVYASACDAVRVVFAVEWPGATFRLGAALWLRAVRVVFAVEWPGAAFRLGAAFWLRFAGGRVTSVHGIAKCCSA